MKPEQAWNAVLGQLQLDMQKSSFDTWVKDAEFVSYEDGLFIIGVKNPYACDWLEARLTTTVTRILNVQMGRTVEVRFIVWQNTETASEESLEEEQELIYSDGWISPEHTDRNRPNETLNRKYAFTNFVVGPSNLIAHAACLAVAENPAEAYNPLFLYGGVGLGKTHLLQAIGNHCANSGLNVLYVSSEEFTNDLINGIRTRNTQPFRDKYRTIDVLLIDDIQFLATRESTQEEFFHTFNTLHAQNKQIIISSDRSPKAMVTLENRLRSRFEGGLTVDIQLPDLETRLAILQSKCDRMGKEVPGDMLELIARKISSNIRELEGALTKVVAISNLTGNPVSRQIVEMALTDLLPRRNEVEPNQVMRVVSEVFGITVDRLLSRDRSKQVAVPRQIAMYLLREDANMSLPQIGETIGGRDHTTVMHACDKVAGLIDQDDRVHRQLIEIREHLYGQPGY